MTRVTGDLKLIQSFPELGAIRYISSPEEGAGFLRQLYEGDFVKRFLNYEARALLEDSARIPIGSDGAVSIAATKDSSLVLRLFDSEKAQKKVVGNHGYLYSQSSDLLLLLVSQQPIMINNYRFSYDPSKSILENFSSMELGPAETVTIEAGQTFHSVANRDVSDYIGIGAKVLFLALTSPAVAKFNFAFDPHTRKAVQIIAADNEDSRMEYVSQVLAALDARDAVPQLVNRLNHPNPSVRWRLARDILQLDADVGRQVIERLAVEDEDVLVRNSAQKSIAILEGMADHGIQDKRVVP